MKTANYSRFCIMLMVSFMFMYVIMFLNVNEVGHVYINMTRLYMTIMMISVMAILMLVLMPMMYTNKTKNALLIFVSCLFFVCSFAGVHKQIGISDVQYMKGMIPHHSIAIMTSENATIKDPRVKKLADNIIATQEKEIREMRALIDSLQQNVK